MQKYKCCEAKDGGDNENNDGNEATKADKETAQEVFWWAMGICIWFALNEEPSLL